MSQVKANSYYDTSGGSNAVLYGVAAPANSMGFRNRIINGDMRIDQRNAGASVTPVSAQYTIDRWWHQLSQTGKLSVQRSTVAPTGFTNSALITSLSAYSVTATDYFNILQSVEGFNVADLGWGTADAQTVTISFRVRSSLTGTFGGAVLNSAQSRAYPFTYAISSANTWETKTVTVPGDTTGTWLTDNGTGLRLSFGLGAGSNYSAAAGSWASGVYLSATGATSVVGTNGATFYITGVQLEAGSVASPFERVDYGRQLIQCQRYYYKSPQTPGGEGFITYQATGGWTGTTCFPVTMRATPTMTYGYTTPYSGNTFYRIDTGGTTTVTLTQNLVSTARVMTVYDGGQSGIPLGTNFSTYLTANAEL